MRSRDRKNRTVMNTSPILITRITVYTALISFLLFPLIYKHAYKRMARGIFIKKIS